MNDQSSTTYATTASQLTELVQGGPMTVEMYMECIHLLGLLLRSSARTTDEITYLAGSKNSMSKSQTQVDKSGPSSTRKLEPPTQENSLLLSHSLCSCCFSEKRDTDNA